MILGWLRKKTEQTQQYEFERFFVSLQGADTDVIDSILGTAMFWAAIYKNKGIDLYGMEEWLMDELLFPTELNRLIKVQQKQGTMIAATGIMVWLFSARALLYPEMRLGGRNLWGQLSRASERSEMIALASCSAMGLHSPWIDRTRIPYGLENIA